MDRRRARAGIDTDKLALLERFGSQMLATARRYSASVHDAEDAYQRAAEILLTHDPPGTGDDILRWLRTTVKHEALAIRRRQDRVLPAGAPERLPVTAPNPADTQERAERFERLRQGARALHRLKPQEVRCLLMRAEGYSYREICHETGWTYTKVNRCLTEGRRSFAERLAGIESGEECERIGPLLSALADGEARTADLALLRPHLRECPSCRATLREYRALPSRVAALVPPGILVAAGPHASQPLRGLIESAAGAIGDRAAAVAERSHQTVELATAQKVAAVAASAAALAGGGVPRHGADRAALAPAGAHVAKPSPPRRAGRGRPRVVAVPRRRAPAPRAVTQPRPPRPPVPPRRAVSARPAPAAPQTSAGEFAPARSSSAPIAPTRGPAAPAGRSAGAPAGEFAP